METPRVFARLQRGGESDPQSKQAARELAAALIAESRRRGLLLMESGIFSNVVRFLPPLVVTEEQVDRALEIVGEALQTVDRQ